MQIGLGLSIARVGRGPSFSPTDLAGLELWFDFGDAATITEAAGELTAVADKSGNGNDGTATGTIDYSASVEHFNDRGRVLFTEAAVAHLAADGAAAMFVGDDTPHLVASVFRPIEAGTSMRWYVGRTGTNSERIAGRIDGSSPANLSYLRDAATIVASVGTGGLLTLNGGPYVVIERFAAGAFTGIVDGVKDPDSAANDVEALNTLNLFTLGAQRGTGSPTAHWGGELAEILVYSVVPDVADLNRLQNYLAAKYAIATIPID